MFFLCMLKDNSQLPIKTLVYAMKKRRMRMKKKGIVQGLMIDESNYG